MKRIVFVTLSFFSYFNYFSQLSGTLSVPSASYSSLAAVIAALNQQGVSGALVVNINSGYTEVAPSGGFVLTASGTNTSPITFQKLGVGANPLITAYLNGTGTPGSMNQDGIWRLVGSDFITIDGIDLLDTNVANPSTMEFGYGLFKADAGNGCWNNVIKNCVITLNRINNASGSGPASDGSRGIDVVNALPNAHNAAITVTASGGSHSNNKFSGNIIQNCNQAITLIGYQDTSPFLFCDNANEVGGNANSDGNSLLDFGGGGTNNASAAIRTLAQHNFSAKYNVILNNTGVGINHAATLRGIYLGNSLGANVTISHNTISLNSGGVNNQLSLIENQSGSGANSNTITIHNNLIYNCTYENAVSPTYYGIWNSASPAVLSISNNTFINNSTHASSGSTYLIYNNGAVTNSISITNNQLGFVYAGSGAYNGSLYSIANFNGTLGTHLTISNNNFSNYYHLNASGGGNLFFITNTNDSHTAKFCNNSFTQLNLSHSGSIYFIHNSSATQSLLAVCNNSIIGGFQRSGSTGPFYGYYANGNSPSTSTHSISANNFSNIIAMVTGTGVFYGIHSTDGNSSPYPKKIVRDNVIENINVNTTGNVYAYYLDKLGDAFGTNGSEIVANSVSGISSSGSLYGMYLASVASPSYAVKVVENKFQNLQTNGISATIYGAYLASSGKGINFYKNKIAEVIASGTAAVVHGVYVTSAMSNTLSNNLIGNLSTPNSSANNAINGIYINSGSSIYSYYNSVYLNAVSTSGNFNSNALYASSTVSLDLRNSILINTSSGGTGISSAFRRSSNSLSTYSSTANNNLFYAGSPSSSNVLLQSGSSSYQTISSIQTALTPREAASVTQSITFLSVNFSSPNYLHITPNIFTPVESGASNLAGIAEDIDLQTRHGNSGYIGSGTAPDIGADEFEMNLSPCNSATAGTISTLSMSICAGQTISLNSTGYTPGTGLSHQWKVSSIPGGPYVNVASGLGLNTTEYYSSPLNSGTYYFILETSCINMSLTSISLPATVVVNAIPSVTAAVMSNLVCKGQNIQLIGISSLVGTYSWLGPNGFYSSAQNPTLTNASSNATGNYSFIVSSNNCVSPLSTVSVNISQVSLSITANPPLICYGSSSTLTAVSSANTFTWSNGSTTSSIVVSPTNTGVYSVVVTNTANCNTIKSITLALINPTISSSGVLICGNSGTTVLSVNAFTPSIVNWYSTLSSSVSIHNGNTFSLNLNSDTTVFVEAHQSSSGCISSRLPVSVTVSPYPILSVVANPSIVCPGKNSTLTVSGATTYSWISLGSGATKMVSPITNKSYTVIGKSLQGCITTDSVLITVHPIPSITIQQSATSICPSSVLTLTASGAISYTWNTGSNGAITTVTPATNTSYSVYGSNNLGCIASKTIGVSTRSVPVITIKQSVDSLCPGQVITFTASGANSYTWLPGGIISTTFSASPMITTVYNAIGKSVNTCTQIAFVVVNVKACTNVTEINARGQNLSVFPNPTRDKLVVKSNFIGQKKISLINEIGTILFELKSTSMLDQIDLSGYSKGLYLLKVEFAESFELVKVILE